MLIIQLRKILLLMVFGLYSLSSFADVITWVGGAPNDENNFLDCRNWDLGRTPLPEDDVVIPGGLTDYPDFNFSDGVRIRTLRIQNGATLEAGFNSVFIDAQGSDAAAAVIIEAGGTLEVGGGQPIFVRNASGDGILNMGSLIFDDGFDDLFNQLVIENVGGIGINNQGEVVSMPFRESSVLIRNTGGPSIVNSGTTFDIIPCSIWRVDNSIVDNAGNFFNDGTIIERGSGNSNINEIGVDGTVYNLNGGTFSIGTNNGIFEDSPNVLYSIACGNTWWSNRVWRYYRIPKATDTVVVAEAAGGTLNLYNQSVSNHESGSYTKIKGLIIPAGRTLRIRCATLEVENLNVEGTLLIGDDANGYNGKIIVTNNYSNTGSIENDGEIVNLTGGALGGTIIGTGTIATKKADIVWTGAVDNNWDNAGNWDTGAEPGAADEVYIPACTTCPVINTNGNTVASIFLDGDLNVGPAGRLNIDGANLSCDQIGLTIVEGTFNNEGRIRVFNTEREGITSIGGTINNEGRMVVSETGAHGVNIMCDAMITNQADATLKLFNTGAHAIVLATESNLYNHGLIDIDTTMEEDVSGINQSTVDGKGVFTINNSRTENTGRIDVLNCSNDALQTRVNSTLINSGTIRARNSEADGVETDIDSYTHNTETGRIIVIVSGFEGMEADEGSRILNEGYINLDFAYNFPEEESFAESIDIDEVSEMINRGTLIITNAGGEFIEVDEGSRFVNEEGAIFRGNMAGEEGLEVDEHSEFINRGNIDMINMGDEGIENDETSRFLNYGNIRIRNVGLQNDPDPFSDENPLTDREGIENDECSYFFNCGTIVISDTSETLRMDPNLGINIGIQNDELSRFVNYGPITIRNADSLGIENRDSSMFVNNAEIRTRNVVDTALMNGGSFLNDVCGFITARDGVVNREDFSNPDNSDQPMGVGTFNNKGQMLIRDFFINRNGATFTNNGAIADPDGVVAAASVGGTIVNSTDDLGDLPGFCEKKCDIIALEAGNQKDCEGNSYTQEIIVEYFGAETANGTLLVEIDGNGQFIEFEATGSPQTIELELPANGQEHDIFVKFEDTSIGCTFRAERLFRAPRGCGCDITDIEVENGPDCDGNGSYSICFKITGINLPANFDDGRIVIGGQPYQVDSYTPHAGYAIVCVSGLSANGRNNDVWIQAASGCSFFERGLFNAPRECGDNDDGDEDDDDNVPCDITNMQRGATNCDGNGTYSQEIILSYVGAPSTGQIAVEINRQWTYHPITGSPQSITVSGLDANGQFANVFAKFTAVSGCTWYERSFYRAPSDCGNARIGTEAGLEVFPSPSKGLISLSMFTEQGDKAEVQIFNAVGQRVKSLNIQENNTYTIDLSNQPAGVYTVKVIGEDYVELTKIVLER